MQHHISELSGVDGISECAIITSSAEATPSSPVSSAKMTRRSASFLVCDVEQDLHFLTGFIPRSVHIIIYLSQTDLRSCRTFLIPFACPLSSRFG